ncbi:hypothetical protein GCM10020254_37120 [Streptomyces goshikiensis]
MVDELPESVALLLLSPAADTALAELLRTLDDHPAVRTLTLKGFLAACSRTDDTPCPPLLSWATRSGSAAPGIARLLRITLGDREHNERAEGVLRDWVRAADRAPDTERALAALLPALATGPREAARLDHLLDTVQGLDGRPQPAAAARLRAGLVLALSDTPRRCPLPRLTGDRRWTTPCSASPTGTSTRTGTHRSSTRSSPCASSAASASCARSRPGSTTLWSARPGGARTTPTSPEPAARAPAPVHGRLRGGPGHPPRPYPDRAAQR